jgi:hypothetical protein
VSRIHRVGHLLAHLADLHLPEPMVVIALVHLLHHPMLATRVGVAR